MQAEIRKAGPGDAVGIRRVFRAAYGDDYLSPEVYDLSALERWIAAKRTVVFVAVRPGGEVVGTAALDLRARRRGRVGEFGRLCVHPASRGRGLGCRLMKARLAPAERRILVGCSETRAASPAATAVGLRHGFRPVGFLPSKDRFAGRESSILMLRSFADAFDRRRTLPRIIPAAAPVAREALAALGLPDNLEVVPFAPGTPEPGIVVRAVSGPGPGVEVLAAIAGGRENGGLTWRWSRRHRHGVLRSVRAESPAVRAALLGAMVERAERRGAFYLEADVPATDPGLQATLVELGFGAGGYLPAAASGPEGRIDLLRMIRVDPAADLGPMDLHPAARRMAALVAAGSQRASPVPGVPATRPGIRTSLRPPPTSRRCCGGTRRPRRRT